MPDLRLTIWNEGRHEQKNEKVRALYPDGMHETIAKHFRARPGFRVRTATLDQPEHGLTEDVLADTDVLTWWGHLAHGEVQDAIVDRVQRHVLTRGLGLIVLHSGHMSKIFRRLMGTTGNLRWREAGERERLWVVNPHHPITQGLGDYFELPHTEMYGEFFDIPEPEALVFISWFQGGEVCRSGCCYNRGAGRVFYFQPGHETYPSYHDATVQQVLRNAVRWAAPTAGPVVKRGNVPPLEKLGD